MKLFTAFYVIVLFYLVHGMYMQPIEQSAPRVIRNPEVSRQILGIETRKENQGVPVRLKIPSLNVDAAIESVGLTPQGAMGVPQNALNVGLFTHGPRPGERGSAVIAGHFDGKDGTAGVFIHLSRIKKGDIVFVEDSKGKSLSFIVQESRVYDPGYADDVFSRSDTAHLNLITCYGAWNDAKESYSKRLIVFTDIIE